MLKRIKARNFLSLRDIDLELGNRNVLVGPNMSGKSNLMECLKFLQQALGLPSANNTSAFQEAISSRGGFEEIVWKGEVDGVIELEIIAELPGAQDSRSKSFKYKISIGWNRDPGYAELREENLTSESEGGSEAIVQNAAGKMKVLWGAGAVEGPQNTQGLSLEQYGRQRSFAGYMFWEFVASWRFYHLLPALMRQGNPPKWETHLLEHGENLSAWLFILQNYHEEFQRIKQVCRDVLPDLAEVLFQPVEAPKSPMKITDQASTFSNESAKISVGVSEMHSKRPISIARMSDGELAFLALMSLILAPDELTPPVLCIEEPENYLHPRLLEVLVELLNQRQREAGAPQAIVTTHSPLLVDKLTIDDLIVVEKLEGATKFTRASSKKGLRQLLARKEASLGDLWYSGALSGS